MNDIEKYLQSKGLSKATIKCYNTEILEFITWCDKENIESENATTTEVTSYLKHLQNKGQQGITRSINLNTLKHYFDYLIGNEIRNDNPAKHIKLRGTKQKHLYPIFTNFKGGKGVATSLGMVLAIQPDVAAVCIAIFVLVLLISNYVSLSSILASLAFPVLLLLNVFGQAPPLLVGFGFFIFLVVALKHYQNIGRIINGTEGRVHLFGKKK